VTLLVSDFLHSKRIIFHGKSNSGKGRKTIPNAYFAWLIFSHVTKSYFRSGRLKYYCEMRDSLKHIFNNQVVLEDSSIFYYSISPYDLKNALGHNIAVLQEYNFEKKGDDSGQNSCKLYKTKDGNWYDFENSKMSVEKGLLRLLKSAIDAKENKEVTGV
jgi:hypothetical protein